MKGQWLREKLAPMWVALWLVLFLAPSSVRWVHANGSLCVECPRETVVAQTVVSIAADDCCPSVAAPQSSCRACCAPAPDRAPQEIRSSVALSTLPTRGFTLREPFEVESLVVFIACDSRLGAAPRGPPRGRAPPLGIRFHL